MTAGFCRGRVAAEAPDRGQAESTRTRGQKASDGEGSHAGRPPNMGHTSSCGGRAVRQGRGVRAGKGAACAVRCSSSRLQG